jgi:predicted DNA-binding protein (MmcQ/YjbR family)
MPGATEDFPFDETTLAFRIGGKIFAMIDLERTEWFVLKCDPDRSLELRESYPEIAPAWHMNKKHWNQLNLFGHLPNELIEELIRHSYELVARKLPRRERFLTDERCVLATQIARRSRVPQEYGASLD